MKCNCVPQRWPSWSPTARWLREDCESEPACWTLPMSVSQSKRDCTKAPTPTQQQWCKHRFKDFVSSSFPSLASPLLLLLNLLRRMNFIAHLKNTRYAISRFLFYADPSAGSSGDCKSLGGLGTRCKQNYRGATHKFYIFSYFRFNFIKRRNGRDKECLDEAGNDTGDRRSSAFHFHSSKSAP